MDLIQSDLKKFKDEFLLNIGNSYKGAHIGQIAFGEDGAAAEKWVKTPSGIMLFTGPCGIGKTHFCAAVGAYIIERGQKDIRYFTEPQFLSKLRISMKDGSISDYIDNIRHLCDARLLMLDDFGASGHSDFREEVMLSLFDYRLALGPNYATLITTNMTRQQIYEQWSQLSSGASRTGERAQILNDQYKAHPRIGDRLFSKINTIWDGSSQFSKRTEPEPL